jgi:predicted ATPase
MIKGLALTNFKSIGKTLIANDEEITEGKLDFAPLTIFCGKNSSGKSTVLQSILLLAQTLQNNVPSQTLVLNGPMVKLGGVNDIKSEFNSSKDISIDIDFNISKPTKGASASLEFREKYSTINKTGCIEEEIFLEEQKKYFKYSLSNDLDQIILTINSKTRFNFSLEDIEWKLNPVLSKKVKDLMDKYQVNYSMTTYSDKYYNYLYINKRIDNEWFIFSFLESPEFVMVNNEFRKSKYYDTINNININVSNQNINLYVSFFNKKTNDISNIIPIINQIHFNDEYIINNIPYSVNFSALRTTKFKKIDTKDNIFERFTFKFDYTTEKIIRSPSHLIGLRLNHFLPKEFVIAIHWYRMWLDSFINNLKNIYLKKEYQFDKQSIYNYNFYVQRMHLYLNRQISITNILISEDQKINNEQLFKQHVGNSIAELKKINKKEFFNNLVLSSKINKDLNPKFDNNNLIPYLLQTEYLPVNIQDSIYNISNIFQNGLIYIGPLREEPHLQYESYITSATNIGIKGENFAGALYQNKNKLDSVKEWLRYIGVASDIIVNFNGRYGYELKIKSFGKNKTNDLTNVGVGVSQVLPIVLTCLLAPEESTIIIEQPELHLHPAMQSKLADFFVATILCNKQLIIETHSEYIINRLRLRAINWSTEKPIDDSVKIYFTENLQKDYKDYKKGNTIFKPLKINEYAAMSEWPEGFFDESSKTAEEIMNEVINKMESKKQDD